VNKFGYYILHILFGLVIVQILKSQQSNYISLLALFIILVHSYIIFNILNEHFLFIIYLFSLCIIYTSDTFGGITLAPFLIFTNYIRVPHKFDVRDRFVKICLIILAIANFSGYIIINPTGLIEIVQSAIIFSGFLLTFIFVQNFKLSESHLRIILLLFTFISVLSFLVAVNQRFILIDSSIPLLGAVRFPTVSILSSTFDYGRIPSLLCDYELFAEFSLLFFIFAFSIIIDKGAIEHFKFGFSPYILLLSSFLSILITGTRSCFLLAVLFIFVFTLFRFREILSKTAGRIAIMLIFLVPFLIFFGGKIGLNVITDRIKEINVKNLSVKNIRSGEEMNRSLVYEAGYLRLSDDNWLIGFGFSRSSGNRWAWHGNNLPITEQAYVIEDFHSLYLCIPMIYGWSGTAAYLIMIIYIIVMLFKKYFILKNHPLGGIALGFAFMLIFFLIDQLKINSLRYYNYHYFIWILLGMALAVSKFKISTHEDSLVN
jgi:hypothetical protein